MIIIIGLFLITVILFVAVKTNPSLIKRIKYLICEQLTKEKAGDENLVEFEESLRSLQNSLVRMKDDIEALRKENASLKVFIQNSTANQMGISNKLNDKILKLNKELERITTHSQVQKQVYDDTVQREVLQNALPTKEINANDMFFLHCPLADGSFDINSGSRIRDYEHPYQAAFLCNERNQISFSLSTVNDISLLESEEAIIKPACDIIKRNNNPVSIRTLQKGLIVKVNDRWVIKQKAQIELY